MIRNYRNSKLVLSFYIYHIYHIIRETTFSDEKIKDIDQVFTEAYLHNPIIRGNSYHFKKNQVEAFVVLVPKNDHAYYKSFGATMLDKTTINEVNVAFFTMRLGIEF